MFRAAVSERRAEHARYECSYPYGSISEIWLPRSLLQALVLIVGDSVVEISHRQRKVAFPVDAARTAARLEAVR
jgi:hypothetical protein